MSHPAAPGNRRSAGSASLGRGAGRTRRRTARKREAGSGNRGSTSEASCSAARLRCCRTDEVKSRVLHTFIHHESGIWYVWTRIIVSTVLSHLSTRPVGGHKLGTGYWERWRTPLATGGARRSGGRPPTSRCLLHTERSSENSELGRKHTAKTFKCFLMILNAWNGHCVWKVL